MEDTRDLQSEVYKSKLRFHTTAMITDNGSDDKKSQGILLTVPLFPAGMKMHLKNVKLVTSAVNTCKSQTAINAVDGEIYNRKYTLELEEAFDNLLNKLNKLRIEVEPNKNTKYKLEDIDKVCQFLQDIKKGIGNNDDNIAGNIYESSMLGTDLVATIDRIRSEKVNTWALAFAGYNDVDHHSLVTDDKKRNPVDIFFGNTINTKNGSDLKTLIGTNQLENINKQLISKLEKKDFSKKLRDSSIERNYGYNYFLCYFVQALLQIVLIDNKEILTSMDCAIIKSNWDKFLKELSDPGLKNMFDDYKPDKIEDQDCPHAFVDFMLNKLLGKDLLKKLEIDNARCNNYAEGSISISKSLSEADHANQIIAMGFDHNSDNLTYDNSLFIGQGEFVYTPIYKAYKNMDNKLKLKLRLLAFELKTKKIKLDQSEYTTSDEYKFGRIQEVEYKHITNSEGKSNRTNEIKTIKYKVPNDYDTDISAEDLMDLLLKVHNIEKDFNDKLQEAISAFDKDKNEDKNKDENEDKNGKAKLFLDALIKFQKVNILLENDQIQSVLENEDIVEAIFNVVNSDNCDAKYTSVYSWFINGHKNVVEQINLEFLKLDLLTADGARGLFNRTEYTNFQISTDDTAKLFLTLWKINAFDETLIRKINSYPDIIKKMFEKNKECTNQIIIKFLGRFNDTIIQNINLADDSLSDNQINEIFYNKHKILSKEQISKINCSKLNDLSIKILFKDHLADISQHNVETFSNIALEELTPSTLANLLKQNNALDFTKHKNWLNNLYLDDLYYQLNKTPKIFISFVAKHMENFSDDQILSLRKNVFETFESKQVGVKKVLNKLAEIEKRGTLEKNIVKIMSSIKTSGRQILAMLVHIYQKSPDDLKTLLSYLIEHNEAFCINVNATFDLILRLTVDKFKEKIFSNYESMYEKLSEDDKKKYKKLDDNGLGHCCLNIQKMLKDILKEDKDSNDISKGKNINYLCLSKLPWTTDSIIKLQDLSGLLSEKQIQSINISDKDFELGNLYSLLDRFGNKLTYEQFHNLISNFNSTKIELLSYYYKLNRNDGISLGILAKIALISNFINEKEKEFQDKYSDIDNTFENTKLELDCIISTFALQKYPDSNEKQMKYCQDNTHNRELYEKSDEAENVNNDLKIGKDDDPILHKLQDLNNELNDKIKELKAKVELDNKINELKGKIESKEIDIDGIKKELEKIDIDDVTDNVLNNVVHNVIGNAKKELKGIKLQNESREKTELNNKMSGLKETVELNNKINELNKKIESKEIDIDDIKKELEEMKLQNDFEQELEKIKSQMKEFDQLYYGRKNKFAKLKTNFLAALGNLDTGKVSICFRNIYANYMENFSDKKKLEDSLKDISDNNKIFWKLDPIVIKVGDQEKKYTFNEFFMDGFIKIQSEQHKDGTESNFSSQQKQFMGIINVVNKTEKKDENNIPEITVKWYTPEYMLEKLPLILEQFHCEENQLENQMKKAGLFDLTLKFDGNKKSLEGFIDSAKLKLIENETVENANDRARNAARNNENHRYFQAVAMLFRKKADHIVENADLVFETDSQNQLQIKSSRSIQAEFRLQLKNLTQKVKDDTGSCLGKEVIINNLTKMDAVPREHFLFFCGDWICHSNNFLSKNSFLQDFKNIVKKRIEFGCRSQGLNKLQLNDETYNLLIAVTLLSGLKAADKLKDMDKTVIDEICFLITGKKEDFLPDDLQLIRSVTKLFGNCDRYLDRLILERVIKNQDYKHVFTCLHMFDEEQLLNSQDKVKWIECISNRDEKIDLMSVISDIDKFKFYPDYSDDYNYAGYGHQEIKLNFAFMQKMMAQLLQKYEFGVYPNQQQKEILGNFLKHFIVDNDDFDKNKEEVSNFFKVLMEKVPSEKSKEVTEEIIKICSNLRENSQRAAILKYVLDASKNSLEGLELVEVLEQHDYARGFILYTENGVQKSIEPIEFDYSLIEKLISDIIEKPLPLTKKEVQRLEWFCTNCCRKDKCKTNNLLYGDIQDLYGDIQDIQRKEAKLFFSLIDKMPEGSMSIDMFKNLVAHFFPSLASNIKDKDNSDTIQKTPLNLMLFYYSWGNREYLYHNKDIDDKDVILNPHIVSRLAYVLPQDKLKEIISLEESCSRYDSDYYNNLKEYKKEYNYCHRRYTKYCISNQSSNKSYTTDEFQKTEKEDRYKYRQEKEKKAEQEEAKKEGTKKMITALGKLNKNKIKKIWTEFKQKCKSAKEREKKNNNDDVNNNNENNIKINEIQKEFININQPKNNNNDDQSHKNIQEEKEKEKEVESSGNKNINNDINKNEEPKIDNNNKIIIKKEIKTEEKREENIIGGIDSKNENGINPQQAQPNSTDKDKNYFINFDVKTDKNNVGNNNPNSGNPYTLSAWLGFLPIVPAIIFGVKTQHKLTGGDIALIIVGIFPVISAIVFGIMAYKYNENNLDSEIPKNLKCASNMDENDIKENQNNTDKRTQINQLSLIVGSMQNQNQNQNQKNKE